MSNALDVYQNDAWVTVRQDLSDDVRKMTLTLGLAGESGEVADMLKKHYAHGPGHEIQPEKLKKELGDVLWYVATVAKSFGFSLSEVADGNIAKLRARYPEGKFSAERSANRAQGDV